MLGKLAGQGTPGVQYGKVNVDQAGALAQRMGVRGIPDTRIFYRGQQVGQFTGYRDGATIERMVAAHLSKVQPAVRQKVVESSGNEAIQKVGGQRSLPPGIRAIPGG